MLALLSLLMTHSKTTFQTKHLLKNNFFFINDEMTVFWPNEILNLTFPERFSNSIPNWITFVNEVFDSMPSLESDKMTPLWPIDS